MYSIALKAAQKRYNQTEKAKVRTKRYQQSEKGRAALKAARQRYQKTGGGKAAKERYRMKNPEKVRAQWAAAQALKKGKLKRGPCKICGSFSSQFHHPDYSKPYEVEDMCCLHHRREHMKEAII